jgi:putative mRNA 3-end processing factor
MPLIEFTDKGLYCRQGNFYIDPWKPVDFAVITHAHSDHARWGSSTYLCHTLTLPILALRLGNNNYEIVEWNSPVYRNGVKISLHPAGHIIGSSQIRVEYKNEVWVISGDYKIENDGISGAFEPIKCNCFITESTFGLPIYQWKPQTTIFNEMQEWIIQNKVNKKSSVLIAYSLGKSQRILQALEPITNTIWVHNAIWNTHKALVAAGIKLPEVKLLTPEIPKSELIGAVVITPGSAEGASWMKKLGDYSSGICSGWMQVRGNKRRSNVEAGFALSDHADWTGLLWAIDATKAEKVLVTHGFQSVLSRYLNEKGIEAAEVKTAFGNEEEDTIEPKLVSHE